LTKCLCLFEACEGEASFQIIKVFSSRPSINTSSVNYVVYEVLVHLLELNMTSSVEGRILSFKFIKIAISERSALNLSWEVRLGLKRNQETKLTFGLGSDQGAGNASQIGSIHQHFY
jgi:hypothetical protein